MNIDRPVKFERVTLERTAEGKDRIVFWKKHGDTGTPILVLSLSDALCAAISIAELLNYQGPQKK